MSITEVKEQLSRVVDQVNRDATRVLIEEDGILVAAIVSMDDLRRLAQLDQEWNERTRAIERFSQAFADVSAEEAEAEVARIIAERRQRRAAEAERQSA